MRKLREEIKEVKGLLKQTRNVTTVSCLPDIPVEFPLERIANLQTLEEYLNSQEDSSNDLVMIIIVLFNIFVIIPRHIKYLVFYD